MPPWANKEGMDPDARSFTMATPGAIRARRKFRLKIRPFKQVWLGK